MDILLNSMKKSIEHLEALDNVFSTFDYPEKNEYLSLWQNGCNCFKMPINT